MNSAACSSSNLIKIFRNWFAFAKCSSSWKIISKLAYIQ